MAVTPAKNGLAAPFGTVLATVYNVPVRFAPAVHVGVGAAMDANDVAVLRLAQAMDQRITYQGRGSGASWNGKATALGYPKAKAGLWRPIAP